MRRRYLASLCCLLLASTAHGQPTNNGVISEIHEAYRQLEYDDAERMAIDALEHYAQLSPAQLSEIHTYLGLIAYNRGELENSRKQFLSALQLTPNLTLDPVLVPPKIQEFFKGIQAELGAGEIDRTHSAIRYVLIRDRRPEAALRSMVFPGWGQLHKGQDVKAGVYSGLFAVGSVGLVVSNSRRSKAKRRYERAGREDASVPADSIRSLYDDYERWDRRRTGFLIGTGAVWLVSYIDALLTVPPARVRRVSVSASPSRLTVEYRF